MPLAVAGAPTRAQHRAISIIGHAIRQLIGEITWCGVAQLDEYDECLQARSSFIHTHNTRTRTQAMACMDAGKSTERSRRHHLVGGDGKGSALQRLNSLCESASAFGLIWQE